MLHNVSNRYFLLCVIFILGSGRVFSQVNIKERVEIKPSPPVQTPTIKEVALFSEDPNPTGPVHVLVMHPCTVTATATIEMQGTPSSDLYVKTLVGGSIAWYNGHYKDPPEQGSNPITFQIACGSIPIKMESTWEGIDIISTTKTIGSNSASFVFQGVLSGCSYTVRAQLQATIDASYDIASMELTADTNQITQCWGTTTLHSKIRNNKGEEYTGVPCQNPPQPVTISVDSTSDVLLSTPWQQGRSITLPYGDLAVNLTWNYRGETKNSTAKVTLAVGTQTKTTTINLMVDTTLVGLQFEDVASNLLHMMKTKVTVRGLGCGGMGSAPLPDGTSIDLSIIEGMNYGFLVDPATGRQGTHLSLTTREGCVKAEYWAQGDHLGGWVVLQAKSGPTVAELGMGVAGTDLKLRLGRPTIGFGDTTSIAVERGNENDGYSLIPTEWNTMYQIVETDTAGYFYTPDSSKTGSPLIGLYPEARYYAKNRTVNPDSLVLLLMVTSVEPRVGGDDKVKDGSGSAGRPVMLKTVETTRKATKASNGKVMSDMVEPPNLGNGWYHYGMAQLVVKKEEQLDHFKVTLEKDTIAYSEVCRIFVQAKDSKDEDIELDAGRLLSLSVTTNEEYGTLIDKKGDTLKTTPEKLENVPYADLKSGLIKFAAVKKNPVLLAGCKMRAELKNDANRKGDTTIVVVEQTLKIVMQQPYQVRPSIPTEDRDTTRVRQRKKGFEVRMTKGGKPLAGHPIRLFTNYVDSTGGHDHDTTRHVRRPENDDNYGYALLGQSDRQHWPLDTVTSPQGNFLVTYHASIFGDSMKITAISRDSTKKKFLRDSLIVVEKVDSLQPLPDDPNYDLVGGNVQHHGPPQFRTQRDDHNHYARQEVIRHLGDIARAFREAFPQLPKLAINDMSLLLGGKFDIVGKWTGSHDYHRNGLDGDVRSSTMPGDRFHDADRNDEYNPEHGDYLLEDNNGNGLYDADVLERFRRIALRNQVQRALLENPNNEGGRTEHWHLFFWN